MSFPKEQLINAIVIGISVIFLGKLFAPILLSMFNNLFSGDKPKKTGSNLEAMIAHKEALLRKGENKKGDALINQAALQAGVNQKRAGKSEVEIAYLDKLEELKKEEAFEEVAEDIQKVVSLFESLQWGEGQALSEIRSKFSKKFGSAPGQRTFLNYLKNLIKREVFLKRASGNLPQYGEVVDLLIVKTFFQTMVNDNDDGQALAKSVAHKMRIPPIAVKRSVATLLEKAQDKAESQIFAEVLEKKDPFEGIDLAKLENQINKCLISEDKKYFLGIKELIEKVTAEAHLFHTLSPLPELKGKDDQEGALKIFGLPSDTTPEEIKKTYKKLSLLKHPDRLASKGIPKQFEDIANQNFTQIQAAYEILKKKG